jgi:hypothetical protein
LRDDQKRLKPPFIRLPNLVQSRVADINTLLKSILLTSQTSRLYGRARKL